ncbi:hypothetical protein SAMN04490357_7690 [Streptomyces misionensis]|uniref:Uncharacterized protein n=1 Tax=Streptomyces misionensis TaxID=67331 RepID=A0A1H5K3A9_9ACTN|nr:hypothetical protein [Streptomyces misionensis]SEE59306.1 hypothetical protein SAMN04490357_7690 [Streptomyces misionensis]
MRKRTSKPQRFAAVENDSIDNLSSLLAVGLLTRLIRAKDGEDVTVETLCEEYAEGETALSKAMRILVEGAYVVKFKVQRATSEPQLDVEGQPVLDDKGKPVIKRGGSWYTTFQVDAHGKPFTAEEVAEEFAAILAGGNVKAIRVEPERLDPRKVGGTEAAPAPARPTPKNRGVGQMASPQVGPTPAFPGVGQSGTGRPTPHRPGVGQGGALIRNKTVLEDSLSSPVTGAPADPTKATTERENSAGRKTTMAAAAAESAPVPGQRQEPDELEPKIGKVVEAYVLALNGVYPLQSVVQRLRAEARELLALNWPVEHVAKLAGQLPGLGYSSLTRHAEHNPPPAPKPMPGGAVPWCGNCDSPEYRWIAPREGSPRRCPECNPVVVFATA